MWKKSRSRAKVGIVWAMTSIACLSRGLSAGEGMHRPGDGTLRPHFTRVLPAGSVGEG
ncbi:hypothetical protein WN944_003410 [Citrus x changshan-huyou]|uniref:Uncharacterized protein n=1 Tax=Citrus x changshan-huyou TaxID=2935761 RepID=A0AAP0QFE8_9ROSI